MKINRKLCYKESNESKCETLMIDCWNNEKNWTFHIDTQSFNPSIIRSNVIVLHTYPAEQEISVQIWLLTKWFCEREKKRVGFHINKNIYHSRSICNKNKLLYIFKVYLHNQEINGVCGLQLFNLTLIYVVAVCSSHMGIKLNSQRNTRPLGIPFSNTALRNKTKPKKKRK